MKILDWYILKRYLGTFLTMLLLFIPIGITVNLAEKIDKILVNEAPFSEVAIYYFNFTIYFANLLFPLFLFLSVIWFTSKLANNTEVIAFLSSGVSFYRFLRPYIIGATLVCIGAYVLGTYLAPAASRGFNEFTYQYLKSNKEDRETQNVYRQISDDDYIYVSRFNPGQNLGNNFTLEHFEGNTLEYKLHARSIVYKPEDTSYSLNGFTKRIVGKENDIIDTERNLDTIFNFELEDLTPVEYIAETLSTPDLRNFIAKEKSRGSSAINRYEVVLYKRFSLPVSAYILTIIAVSVSAIKRRGGMGINLALGISLAFVFIFFDKVFTTISEQSDFSPIIAVWLPNILFGMLAVYLLRNAKR